jgi:hypothetical protein
MTRRALSFSTAAMAQALVEADPEPRAAMPGRAAVLELPLLDAQECLAVADQLCALDAFWLHRHRRLPFYTLGATHYYDLGTAPSAYFRLARQYNPFLQANFGAIYEALTATLAEALAAPVVLRSDVAWPGFHLFGADPAFAALPGHDVMQSEWLRTRHGDQYPGNPIHVDLAHRCLPWPPGVDPEGLPTLSLTLPIALPASGAGLYLWPQELSDVHALDAACEAGLQRRLQKLPRRFIRYQPGRLVVHGGSAYHQARGLPTVPGEFRMTLQGNGLRVDGVWHLFW